MLESKVADSPYLTPWAAEGPEIDADEIMGAAQAVVRLVSDEGGPVFIHVAGLMGGEGASTVARGLAHAVAERADVGVCLASVAEGPEPADGRLGIADSPLAPSEADAPIGGGGPRPRIAYRRLVGRSRRRALSGGLVKEFSALPPETRVVIVDSGPTAGSVDAAAIARQVNGVVLVLESDRTSFEEAAEAKTMVQRAGGDLLGFVVNKRRHRIPRWIARLIGMPTPRRRGARRRFPVVLALLLALGLIALAAIGVSEEARLFWRESVAAPLGLIELDPAEAVGIEPEIEE